MRMRALATMTALIVLIGISLAGAPTAAHAQKAPKRQRDLVTREELMSSAQAAENMYDAIRSLRPRFLEGPRGVRSLGGATVIETAVVLDGKVLGNLDVLRTIMASTVDEARYLEPSKAGTEYGNAAGGGAVVVKSYRPKAPAKSDSVPVGAR